MALVSLVYCQVPGHGFLNYQDPIQVTDNPMVNQGFTRSGLALAFTKTGHFGWHPATRVSHMLDYELWGDNPAGHHLTSILLHAATTVVLFLVLFWGTGAMYPSLFVAAMHAVHPYRVESVAWVAQRTVVLSSFFVMCAALAYLWYARKPRPSRYLAVLSLFGAALFARPLAAALPLGLLVLDYWPLGRMRTPDGTVDKRRARWLFLEKIPFLVLSLGVSLATMAVRPEFSDIHGGDPGVWGRLAQTLAAYVNYIWKTIWPAGMALPAPPADTPPLVAFAAGLFLAVVTWIVVGRRRTQPWLTAGWLAYLVSFLSVVGVLAPGAQSSATARYMYLPSVGLWVMAAWGIPGFLTRFRVRWAAPVLGALAVCLYAASGYQQAGYWRDSETLFTRSVANDPDNYLAHYHLGLVRYDQGRIDDAIARFEKGVAVEPGFLRLHGSLGSAYVDEGYLERGIVHLRTAARMTGSPPAARSRVFTNLGAALVRVGKYGEAAHWLRQALSVYPGNPDALLELANALSGMGRHENSIRYYVEALRHGKDLASVHNNLGHALLRTGREREARLHFEKALEISPGYAMARKNLESTRREQGGEDHAPGNTFPERHPGGGGPESWFALGNRRQSGGDLKSAARAYEQVLEREPGHLGATNNLATVYKRMGDMDRAESLYMRAVELAPDHPAPYYNMSCLWALRGDPETCARWLERAVERGFDDREHATSDPDLSGVLYAPAVQAVLKRLGEQRAAA